MLDSSACVSVLRGRSSLSDLPLSGETTISSVVAAELWVGFNKLGENHPRSLFVLEFFKTFEVLPFSSEAARHYGEIRTEMERKGFSIGPLDLFIAAHALSLTATLITANVGEFKRVKGLRVLAWK